MEGLDLKMQATEVAAVRRMNRELGRRKAIGRDGGVGELKDEGPGRASVMHGKGANHRRNRQHSHHC